MADMFDLGIKYSEVYQKISEGEDSEVYLDTLDSINDTIESKADNYVAVIRKLEGDNDIIDKEIKRLQERKKSNANGISKLRDNLQYTMELSGKTVFKTATNSYGIQYNAPSVELYDETLLPKFYYKEQPTKLDKKLLLKDLKEGKKVKGANIKESRSLRIR